jgi:hypothetical protein
MAEQMQVNETSVRSLRDILKEVERAVELDRRSNGLSASAIRDLRWQFDQVSAKMNQAIYNEQHDKIHDTCLKTVSVLIEILARS